MRTLHSLTGALSSNRARLVLVIAVVVGLLALASAGFAINITAIAARADSAGIASTRNADGLTVRDPWGTAITLRN